MNDLKEQAKKIIAKGKLLNDPELIKMCLDMLDAYPIEEAVATVEVNKSEPERKNKAAMLRDSFDMSMFKTDKESNVTAKFGKKVSVPTSNHVNKFLDDGSEATELKGKTPNITKTERTRKSKMVEGVCSVCGKKEIKNEIFVAGREYYRCENCLLKGKS
jgi:histidyl-tRNA synthetase